VRETKSQAYTSRRWHGRSFIELMAGRGMLGPTTTLVHTVWLTDRDIQLMADTRTTSVHCLLSNLRLGDGVARLHALRDAGVRVALGTDGRGCDETLDMLELAKMTALVHKARGEGYRDWPTAADVHAMTTRDASLCTGYGERLGRIEPGAHGDLVLLDRDSLPFTPLLDPVRQLVYGAPSRSVNTVVVAGEVVVADGRLSGVDEGRMLELARRYAPPSADTEEPATAALLRLQGIVGGLYERAERTDLGLDTYVGTGLAGAEGGALL
jgi:5-methylthioadenosine/S-adenosylhomocysteine deaminase